MTIFDYLNAIFYKKDIKYDKKTAPAYLLSLWLSHDKSLLDVIDKINEFHFSVPDNIIYQYYFNKIPKGKRFIKWVKKEEKEQSKENTKLREELGISKKEFSNFIDLTNVPKKDKIKKNASNVFLKG